MYQPTILFIALRYIRGKSVDQFNQCIFWVSSISMALGIMTLIVILSVMNGFERDVKKNFFDFIPHALLTTKKRYIDSKYVPNLVKYNVYDVVHMEPLVVSNTTILCSTKKIALGVLLGINPERFKSLSSYYLIKQSMHQLLPGKYYIIIGSQLAQQLKVCINDQIRLIIPSVTQITPIGRIPIQRLFTILDIYIDKNSAIDNYQVLVHQTDATQLMCYPPQCVTGWRLWFFDPFKINDFNKLRLSKDWIYKDWREYKGSLFQAMKMEKNIMSLLLSLIIIASGFNIISFLVLLIMDKQKEIAILQTYGCSRLQIMSIFMILGIGNGIFGVGFGTGLGVLLSKQLNQLLSFFKIFPTISQFPVEIQYFQIFIITSITFILILLVTLYPSWNAVSVPPAKILHHD